MSTGWTGATRWVAGPGAVDDTLRRAPVGPRPALVFDPRAAATAPGARLLERVRAGLGVPPADEVRVERSATVAELSALHARWHADAVTAVVAVGGGCTLDVAVLAALPAGVLAAPRFARGRCGLVGLTGPTAAWLPTVAIPTTLGTGAEVSAAACCDRGADGKLLVVGDALRPAYAAVEPMATEGLPARYVREALVEVLARILVPFCAVPTGEPALVATADALALASLHRLAEVAEQVVTDGPDASARLALAGVSAHSHAGWGNVGRPPACSPVWPVATELSTVTGWTKSVANGCLLPAWARTVLAGDDRLGRAGRLRTAWRALSGSTGGSEGGSDPGADAGTDPDPASGLATLVDRWLAVRPAQPGDIAGTAGAVAERASRRWGDGLPMLGRLRVEEIAELVRAGLAGAGALTGVTR